MKLLLPFSLALISTLPLTAQTTLDDATRQQLATLKDYNVVFLGEPSHGEGNVFEYKTEIVKYLHDSLGFNVIAFESGFYDLYCANNRIAQNPHINSSIILNESLFPIWTRSAQFSSFMDYYEKNKQSLSIAGFDCQFTGAYSEDLVDSMTLFIHHYIPSFIPDEDDILDETVEALENDQYPEDVEYKQLQKEINRVLNTFTEIKKKNKLSATEMTKCLWYEQAVANIKGMAADYYSKRGRELNEKTFKAWDSNARDSMMAQNLLALTKLYKGEKIICWGAGAHFMNNPHEIDNPEMKRFNSMGMYVKKAIGDDKVFNMTFISAKGEHGICNSTDSMAVPTPDTNSIESRLAKADKNQLVFLKDSPFAAKKMITYIVDYTPQKADWSHIFDALFYLKEFTTSTFKAIENTGSDSVNVTTVPANNTDTTIVDTSIIAKQEGYHGKLIDAKTGQPIAFASIIALATREETISNNNGEFAFSDKLKNVDSALVYYIGYHATQYALKKGVDNILRVAPLSTQLNEVTIKGKAIKAIDIIKKVKEHFKDNYETGFFYQRGYYNQSDYDHDSLYASIEEIADFYNVKHHKVFDFDVKEERINKKNQAFCTLLGDMWGAFGGIYSIDFFNREEMFRAARYKKYKYQLLRSYDDNQLGHLYIIRCTRQYTSVPWNWLYDYKVVTELTIRKDDYAVITVNHQSETTDIAKVKRISLKEHDISYAKAHHAWKTLPDNEGSIVYCRYVKNNTTGKYFLDYANYTSYEKGIIIDTKQPINLMRNMTFYSLGNIVQLDNLDTVSFDTFKWPNQKDNYHPQFWESFTLPKQNSYYLNPQQEK